VLLALAHTWPLVTAPASLSRTDSADGLLNQWILGWVAHGLATQPLSIFHANIFFPEPRTLAFSEHLFVQSLFSAPVFWAGGSPVLAYNVTLWIGLALSVPVVALEMGGHLTGLHQWLGQRTGNWLQLVLATPVVLWAGWPFFERAARSLITRNLNMFTLIALGTGVAWAYSVVATVAPGIFPSAFRSPDGAVAV